MSSSRLERFKETYEEHKLKILLGTTAVSGAAIYANGTLEETARNLGEVAPWVGSGILISEGLFVAGAVMAVASVGEKVGNPFTIMNRMKEIAKKAHDNKLFQAGFWTNTIGAVGDAAVLSAGIIAKMPPESYPLLSLPLADLGLTIAVRRAIRENIRKAATEQESA